MPQLHVPEAFVRNLQHVLGNDGLAWIDALPGLLAHCERAYGLTVGPPFELSYNYVALATRRDGTDLVLKLSPHGRDFRNEITATRHYDGHGMARLLDADLDRGIAVLERLRPGEMLVHLDADDDAQTDIAAGVMSELLRDPPRAHDLPTTREWFDAFARHRAEHGGAGPLPATLFERGESVYRELLDSSHAVALLHGDLHHYNILSAQRAPWLAIDPHGIVGDPVFEVGAFFGNPEDLAQRPDLKHVLERRSHILSERLGFDRGRVLAWGFAYQVLSAVWSAENGGTGWRRRIGAVEALDALLREYRA
jgi:streptomycin 6-kinase